MPERPVGWKVPTLAIAGIVVLSVTAFAGGGGGAGGTPPLVDASPVAVTMAPTPATDPSVPAGGAASAAASAGPGVVRIDAGWLARTARSAGIPAPALRAYARAQLGAPAGCELAWTTLAGIGWVESQHGTLGGRHLRADGTSSTPILGPALDGSGSVAAIQAGADGRALHGDPVWDHAVGPMQFLPSTWAGWGTDGDGDGSVDPHDIDDAAAAAAAYLCASGGSLTGSAWSVAVLSYNHDAGYVRLVHTAADTYAARTR